MSSIITMDFDSFCSIWRHIQRYNDVLALQKVKIVQFQHHHRVPWVTICNHANLWPNRIICWHSRIICVFLGHILVSDVKMTSQTGSRYKTFEFLHSHRFSRPKNLIHAVLRPKPSFYQVFLAFLGNFESYWGSVTSQEGSRF